MVSSAGNHAQLEGIHKIHRHLVGGLYFGGNAVESADISRETLFGSIESHSRHSRISFPGGFGMYNQRKGKPNFARCSLRDI